MKKLFYTFLAVSIIFAACKKEDEVVTPTVISGCTDVAAMNYNSSATNDDGSCTYSIVGVWTPTSVDQDSSMTTTINGEIIYDLNGQLMTYSGSQTMTPEEAEFEGNIEFSSDGEMFVDGDEMDYTYSNSVLIVTHEDTTMVLPCSVTSTTLSFTIAQSIEEAWTEPGMGDITISAYYGTTIYCTRDAAVSTIVNQRVGNTDYNWFVKPQFNKTKLINSIKQK